MTSQKRIILATIVVVLFISCIIYLFNLLNNFGAGTLGGFDERAFPTSKQHLVQAIDTLFSEHPEYEPPYEWKRFDNWHERGYDFLDSRIFYFSSSPREMYYVSFLGDANDSIQADSHLTSIAIRAVNNGTPGWTLEKEFDSSDRERIEQRFDKEVIFKIEAYTKTKSKRQH
jgi:hypothetical protein